MWISRLCEEDLKQAAAIRPVVLITGARQTGKSSLLKHAFPETTYLTLDYPSLAQAAQESPEHFLNERPAPLIIDEIQYAPSLLRHIKPRIDEDRSKTGAYLLTGSQRFEPMAGVSESLAGRIRILELGTLSAEELRRAEQDTQRYLVRGGYPELWATPELSQRDFFEDYIATYLERDLNRILNVSNIRDFRRLMLACAARIGQLLNYADLARDTGVSANTVKTWINALEASGLVYILQPYHANIGKRLTKAPKLYFADHGLLCHLLNIQKLEQWHAHPLKGSLWENVVFCEYIKVKGYRPGYELFFYRDQNGVDMDFVVESEGKLLLIEAKSGENPDPRKLNFDKVAPLFSNHLHLKPECILACQLQHESALRMKDYWVVNPLLHSLSRL